MRLSPIGAVLLAIVVAAGCSESREEKFEKAMRAAESAQKAVESARKEVETELARYEKASAAAEAAEKKLSKARSRLESAESGATKARAEVAKWADDATVFRSVQRRLLEERSLRDAAVSARVQGGVAYLDGRVGNASQRDRAIQIARETPGVLDVQSQITVGSAGATTPTIAPAPPPMPEQAPVAIEALPAEPIPAEPAPAEASPAEPAPPQMEAQEPAAAAGSAPHAPETEWLDRQSPR